MAAPSKILSEMVAVTLRNFDATSLFNNNALFRHMMLKDANLKEHINFVIDEKLNGNAGPND